MPIVNVSGNFVHKYAQGNMLDIIGHQMPSKATLKHAEIEFKAGDPREP